MSARFIPDQIDRAKRRFTITRWVHPRLSVGVEWNPGADEVGPLANAILVREGERRPAVMFGVSSDRIGTPDGTAYFVTVAKDLEAMTGAPVAPYVGIVYGTWEDTMRAIGGVRVRLGPRWSVIGIHDGVNMHAAVDIRLPADQVLSLLWIDGRDPGVAYSLAF